jgi:hypothetical protein
MEGATRVSNGRDALSLQFQFDRRSVDRLGVAVSRAEITPEQFKKLSSGRAITLTLQSDPRIRFRFPTSRLQSEWRRVSSACRSNAVAPEQAFRAARVA